ncbi:MAG TPA: Hsp20/alpha crystallin family protein [Solirubrobacteraceae bacterium]|jgi:HSP20 family protein|nr:Hsp20/alpha crystallin family protein [Solirubrobacteraceae bacterium]
MSERDLFANFERMRREMDELFGDVFERTGLSRRRAGFRPAVDVVYASDPPRAIVTAELAGVDIDALELEIQGRTLILAGIRGPAAVEGDVYQRVEIGRGRFRRTVELGADVDPSHARARYEDGMLRVELPLAQAGARTIAVAIEPDDAAAARIGEPGRRAGGEAASEDS